MRVKLRRDRLLEVLGRSHQSQNYWAMRLGLARGHWSEIVNGKHPYPSGRTRERLLEVLGISFEELFEVEAGSPAPEIQSDGTVGGRYLVDRELGRGGMGTVFLARDLRLGRPVALKMVSPEVVSGIGVEQFLREIGYAARLHHPHVLPLYDAGEGDGHPYYVMAYLRDGSVRELLTSRHRLPLDQVVTLVRGIGAGLACAHAHDILHCDVKPENILLAGDHPYVGDFGIARAIYQESFAWGKRSGVDSSAGTPAYVSPEQAAGEQNLDRRADVYSLAALTFELLAGRAPFVGTTPLDTVSLRFKEAPPDVRRFAPEVPAGAADAIAQALSFDRDDRQPGADRFADELALGARRSVARAVARAAFAVTRATGRLRRRLGLPPGPSVVAIAHDTWSDVRSAARAIRRAPAWAAVIILTLGLAIGANATMFGIVDRLLLRAPAYVVRPDRVHRVRVARWFGGLRSPAAAMSYPAFQDLRDRTHAFTAVAAYDEHAMSFGSGTDARQVDAVLATGQYFLLFGVQPYAGRFFGAAEDAPPDGIPVAVLGHGFWRRAFGGDPAVVGRSVELDGRRFEVIGIAPAGFTGAELAPVDVWLPMSSAWATIGDREAATARGWQFLETFVRRRDGVTLAVAAEDARRAYHDGHVGELEYEARAVASLAPLIAGRDRHSDSPEARVAAWLLGMAVIVLLIACANVANLMLGRGLARQAEIAVRQALGGSRVRVLRHLVTESAVLAVLGAAVGLALAAWGAGFVRRTLLPDVSWDVSPVEPRVLVLTAAATLIAVVGAGLLPFLRGTRLDLARALHGASRGRVTLPRRLLATLLVVQTSLATALLIGAGLFVQSLRRVQTLDLGFAPDRLLQVRVDLEQAGLSPQEIVGFHRGALERVRAVPGVTHAGVSVGAPFMANYAVGIQVTGMDSLPQLAGGGPYLFTVGGGALEALGVRLRSGRLFNEMDDRRGAAPVAVITERTARLLWPDADPLGRCLTVTDVAGCAAVVGVVADLHRQGLREPPFMALFLPLAAVAPDRPPQIILVRTAGPPDGLVESLRRSLLALRPDLPYVHIQPYEELIANQARSWRLGAIVFIAFGVLSLAIAAIGVYGVLSFTVARRMPELGIRAALGATSRTVLRMVVGGGVATAVAGVALGCTLGLVFSGRIQGLLFETSGREPAVFLVAGATIVTLALAASLAPGIRAARADPLAVLRAE